MLLSWLNVENSRDKGKKKNSGCVGSEEKRNGAEIKKLIFVEWRSIQFNRREKHRRILVAGWRSQRNRTPKITYISSQEVPVETRTTSL
jgi:hypothetical protein